jgi:hypothetical protein
MCFCIGELRVNSNAGDGDQNDPPPKWQQRQAEPCHSEPKHCKNASLFCDRAPSPPDSVTSLPTRRTFALRLHQVSHEFQDISAITSGRHQMDAYVRRYIHVSLRYRFVILPDAASAYAIVIKSGAWAYCRPLLNPGR